MNLNQVLDSMQKKYGCQGSLMSKEEEQVLKANLDNPDAVCFYAMGLIMNSSVRYKKLFFKGYDALQEQAFGLLNQEIAKENGLAVYLMAQIQCGLFGKFPRNAAKGRELFEQYYALTGDESVKTEILDDWDAFDQEMKEHHGDMQIYEVMNDLREQGFSDFSSHDDAYYEEE